MNFSFDKPNNWNDMKLYEKVSYYKSILDKKYSIYVDKIEVKKRIVELFNGKLKVGNIIKILKNPNDINITDLNQNHIIKSSHGSGWNIIINKNSKICDINKKLNKWNKHYSQVEKQYIYIPPRFFIEEKITCKYSGLTGKALTFMVFCFHGEPNHFRVRDHLDNKNVYDINWVPVFPETFKFEKPEEYDKIIEFSKKISEPFQLVRIDFNISFDGIYFIE